MKKILLILTALTLCLTAEARPQFYHLSSPNGRLEVSILNDNGLSFSVRLDDKWLIEPTTIGLTYEQGGKMMDKMTVKKVSRRTIDETIASHFTRQATMRNHCNELTLHLKEGLSVVFRAYDEGVAYRYVWEGKPGKVMNEILQCTINEGIDYAKHKVTATVPYVTHFDSTAFGNEPFILSNAWAPKSEKWAWFDPQYSSSFENQYTTVPLREIAEATVWLLRVAAAGGDLQHAGV